MKLLEFIFQMKFLDLSKYKFSTDAEAILCTTKCYSHIITKFERKKKNLKNYWSKVSSQMKIMEINHMQNYNLLPKIAWKYASYYAENEK